MWLGGLSALALAGCIVEEGDKACGPNQMLVDTEGLRYCACMPGFIIVDDDGGCTPCGEHEVSMQNKCVCEQGYTRPSEGAACMMSDLGGACTDDSGCGGDFPTCAGGYCTAMCSSSTECEMGWICDDSSGDKVCNKPPTGFGMSCQSDDDCKGNEASFCETFQSHSCLVSCSATSPCPGDWGCCDFTIMKICLSPSSMPGGACPPGGTLVTP